MRQSPAVVTSKMSRVLVCIGLSFFGCVLVLGALGWAYAEDFGDTPGYSCLSRAAPTSYPPEGPFFSERTLLPLGTSCEFAETQGTGVVQPEPDWGPTFVAATGIAMIVGGLIYVGRGRARRDRLDPA